MRDEEKLSVTRASLRKERQKEIQALAAELVGQCARKNLNVAEFNYVLGCMENIASRSTVIRDPRDT